MAKKDERIVCRVIEKGSGCDYCFSRPAHNYYQCSISDNDCTYDVCNQCSLGMTRREAIDRMAKALFEVDNVLALDIEFSQLKKQKQSAYKFFAEAALNALLSLQSKRTR